MNKLLLGLLICNSLIASDKGTEFAKTLKKNDCYRNEQLVTNNMIKFENKSYKLISYIYKVLAKDNNYLLIAQPHPQCLQNLNESYKCDYWFRTMDFSRMSFLTSEDSVKIQCPKMLTRKLLLNKLKQYDQEKVYNLEYLKNE